MRIELNEEGRIFKIEGGTFYKGSENFYNIDVVSNFGPEYTACEIIAKPP